jgi:glutathione S-transferase
VVLAFSKEELPPARERYVDGIKHVARVQSGELENSQHLVGGRFSCVDLALCCNTSIRSLLLEVESWINVWRRTRTEGCGLTDSASRPALKKERKTRADEERDHSHPRWSEVARSPEVDSKGQRLLSLL